MKGIKSIIAVLCLSIGVSSCNFTGKGAAIGAAGGTAVGAGLGALVGKLTGNTKLGALIGAGVGAAAGTTAGALIGKKMDKARAAAAAVANAEVSAITDNNGLPGVKVTFDGGILFAQGKSTLSATAQNSLKQFANNVLNVYTDCDVAICGFTNSDGSDATNLTLSQNRADAVKKYLTGTCRVNSAQVKSSTGFGEDPTYLIKDASGVENKAASRRVEVYLFASDAMVNAANAGTLK